MNNKLDHSVSDKFSIGNNEMGHFGEFEDASATIFEIRRLAWICQDSGRYEEAVEWFKYAKLLEQLDLDGNICSKEHLCCTPATQSIGVVGVFPKQSDSTDTKNEFLHRHLSETSSTVSPLHNGDNSGVNIMAKHHSLDVGKDLDITEELAVNSSYRDQALCNSGLLLVPFPKNVPYVMEYEKCLANIQVSVKELSEKAFELRSTGRM